MRWVRSIACASTAGFHQGSSRNTYSAAVRFNPWPPAFKLIRNRSSHVLRSTFVRYWWLSASNIVAQMCLHSSPRSKYGQGTY